MVSNLPWNLCCRFRVETRTAQILITTPELTGASGISSGAVAAAKAAGQSWPDVAKQKIYSPLGMSSTSSTYADFLTRSNRASLHVPPNGMANGTWILGPKRNADAQAPAAGVSSSANDLAQWLRMELANGTYNGKPVVQAEALLEARTPQVVRGTNPATGYPGFYGLGWNWDIDSAGYIVLSHAGAFSQGARTYVHMLPEENIGMIVLSNAFPTGLPEGIAYTFFDYLHYNRSTEDWLQIWDNAYNALTAGYTQAEAPYVQAPSMPAPALNLSAYEGTYNNDYVGNVSVTASGQSLNLGVGPVGNVTMIPLTHWDRDLFLSYPTPELPTIPNSVMFSIGSDGRASQVVLDAFNGDGAGKLTRVS